MNTRKSKPRIDLTNQTFGRWTALEYVKPGKWKCQCSCENKTIKLVEGRNLRSGKSLSCGCLQKEQVSKANSKDYTNMRFGKLIAEKRMRENNITFYLCKCDCGNIIKVDGRNLSSGHTSSCGCIKSKGEYRIGQYLLNQEIVFQKEKQFEDCVDINKLKFDFYLPDLNIIIEYDGEQHYQISRFGNKDYDTAKIEFEQVQKRDAIKTKWCVEKNIKLIRIPYTSFDDIEQILEKELKINE